MALYAVRAPLVLRRVVFVPHSNQPYYAFGFFKVYSQCHDFTIELREPHAIKQNWSYVHVLRFWPQGEWIS